MKKEDFTIVNKFSGNCYDTNDERFYGDSWELTYDTKEYLNLLFSNNPLKFIDCHIVKTRNL